VELSAEEIHQIDELLDRMVIPAYGTKQ